MSAALIVGLFAAPAAADPQPNDVTPDDERVASGWRVAPATDVDTPVALEARITAPHWFVLETATGQGILGFDWMTRRPVASAVKIATALTVIRRAELSDLVVIGDDLPAIVGASVGVRPGQMWTVEGLLLALIGRSGNDVAEILAMHVGGDRDTFLAMMRADLAEIGLDGVIVSDPSGLDDANRFSAHDLAILGAEALANDELRPLLAQFDLEVTDQPAMTSRNLLLERYEGATGIKTGFTQLAGPVLVGSARRGDREVVAVVLDAAYDPARFDDIATLLDYAFDYSRLDLLSIDLGARRGHGMERWSLADVPLTVPRHARVSLRPVWPTYPPGDGRLTVHVIVNGAVAGIAMAGRDTNVHASENAATVGQALADSIYAALRTTARAGLLR